MNRKILPFIALVGLLSPAVASGQVLPETQTRSGGWVIPADPENAEQYSTAVRIRYGSDFHDGRIAQTVLGTASIVPSSIKGLEIVGSYRFRDAYAGRRPAGEVLNTNQRWFPAVGGGTVGARYTYLVFNDLAIGAETGAVLNALVKSTGDEGLAALGFKPSGIGPFLRLLTTYRVPNFFGVPLTVHGNLAYYNNQTWETFRQNCDENKDADGNYPAVLCSDDLKTLKPVLRDQRARWGLEIAGDESSKNELLWGLAVEAEFLSGKLRPYVELTGRPLLHSFDGVYAYQDNPSGKGITPQAGADPISLSSKQTTALRLSPGATYDVLPALSVFAAIDWNLTWRKGHAYVAEVEQVTPVGPEFAGFIGVSFFPNPHKTRIRLERSRRSFNMGGGNSNLSEPKETIVDMNDAGSGDSLPSGTRVIIRNRDESWSRVVDNHGRVRIPGQQPGTMLTVQPEGYKPAGIAVNESGRAGLSLERMSAAGTTPYTVRIKVENATDALADKIAGAGFKVPGSGDTYTVFNKVTMKDGFLILSHATALPPQFVLAIKFRDEYKQWVSKTYETRGQDTTLDEPVRFVRLGSLRSVGGVEAVLVARDEYRVTGVSFRFKKDLAALEPGSEAQIAKLVNYWRANRTTIDRREGNYVIRYPILQGMLENVVAKNRAQQVADQLKAAGLRAQAAQRSDSAREPAVEVYLVYQNSM